MVRKNSILTLVIYLLLCAQARTQGSIVLSEYKTFGTMGKEQAILTRDHETDLFNYVGVGCITHLWFGGSFPGYEKTLIRIYVDQEKIPSISMELFLGHGIGFSDNYGPWGTERVGKTGDQSGVYNTYRIPFGSHIRITAQLDRATEGVQTFWWIVRGTEHYPVVFNGVKLPAQARLKLYTLLNHTAQPLEEFNLCQVDGSGMLYQVTMEAKGLRSSNHWSDLSYMESCIRAYMNRNSEPFFLSSGLEDYFLGTYYFQKGRYTNKLAGLTHFDAKTNEFSAYRFHEEDPVFFQDGFRLTNRCGEKINGKIFHNPPPTRYTTYVWLYQW